jgi:hypothetical protein
MRKRSIAAAVSWRAAMLRAQAPVTLIQDVLLES